MDYAICPMCNRRLSTDPRVKYCCQRHRWRGWWRRSVDFANQTQQLPLASLPAEADPLLPLGQDRLLVATQLALSGRAPTGARGYRVGRQHGQSPLLRWFPAAKLRALPMFALDPFEWPVVPGAGTYAVVYMDGRCAPLGGPRFSIAIERVDPRLNHTDGDRTYKPRVRL